MITTANLCVYVSGISFSQVGVIFLAACVAYFMFCKLRDPLRHIPGPAGLPFLGNVLDLRTNSDIFETLRSYASRYGNIFKLRAPFGVTIVYVSGPEYVKHVLVSNEANYHQTEYLQKLVYFGKGTALIFTNDEQHAQQRKMLNPAFSIGMVQRAIPLLCEKANKLVEFWKKEVMSSGGNVITTLIEEKFIHTTLEVIGEFAFGYNFNTIDNGFTKENESIGKILSGQFNFPMRVAETYLPFLKLIPSKSRKVAEDGTRDFQELVRKIINQKREKMKNTSEFLAKDVLDLLLQQKDDDNRGLTDDDLTCQTYMMLLGGHETTSTGLTWITYLLARYPEVQAKVRNEVTKVLDTNVPLTQKEANELVYLEAVVKESIRMHPIIFNVARTTVHDDQIGPYKIPAGTCVSPLFGGHLKDTSYWSDADQFKPERFLVPSIKDSDYMYVYTPFSRGPRQCIAIRLALMEMKVIIAHLIQSFIFRLSKDTPRELTTRMLISSKPYPSPRIEIHLSGRVVEGKD